MVGQHGPSGQTPGGVDLCAADPASRWFVRTSGAKFGLAGIFLFHPFHPLQTQLYGVHPRLGVGAHYNPRNVLVSLCTISSPPNTGVWEHTNLMS